MHLADFKNRKGESLDTTFHPARREDSLVILGHGVTGNKDRPLLVALAEELSARGWPVLRMSFAGCGASGGRFEDSNITKNSEDLSDLIGALPTTLRLAYCGHSMGAAAGVRCAASNSRISSLISLAGMVYTKEFYHREFGAGVPGSSCMWGDPAFPLSVRYADDLCEIGDTLQYLRVLRVPLLLVHGTADDVVLPRDSEEAYAAVPGRKELVRIVGAEHSFGTEYYPQIVEAIDFWLRVDM